jgi:hypothetical protein
MKKLLAAVFALILPCCAANAQNFGGWMVPSGLPATPVFVLMAKSNVASPITGTASETVLATVNLPANTIGANGQIRIRTYWTNTNSVNNKTLRIRFGTTGISSTQILSSVITTFGAEMFTADLQNLNATNSQNIFAEGSRGSDGLVTTALSTAAIDTTVSENFYITGTLANTGETITLTGYSVEYAF